jgi:hypothetical protein
LDEWIYKVETWTAEDSPVWPTIDPRNLGRKLQTFVTDGHRLVTVAAHLLARHWPEVEQEMQPSPAGEALLARAGAIEASEPVAAINEASIQIAEIPTGSSVR